MTTPTFSSFHRDDSSTDYEMIDDERNQQHQHHHNNTMTQPPRKKARQLTGLERVFHEPGDHQNFGLADLFERSAELGVNQNVSAVRQGGANRQAASRVFGRNEHDFFTLRMEHWEPTKTILNERITIFREEEGFHRMIARIEFEYQPAVDYIDYDGDDHNSNSNDDAVAADCTSRNATKGDSSSSATERDQESGTKGDSMDDTSRQKRMSKAKIVKVEVKDDYQRYDLGGLLIAEMMASLKNRYQQPDIDKESLHDDESDDESNNESVSMHEEEEETDMDMPVLAASVLCELCAEEDTRRYNKLVQFYSELGFSIKPNVRNFEIRYGDVECYREVPMQTVLHAPTGSDGRRAKRAQDFTRGSLMKMNRRFLPVKLLGADGSRIGVDFESDTAGSASRRQVRWVMAESGIDSTFQFRTTMGQYLVQEGGKCQAKDVAWNDPSTRFCLYRVPDSSKYHDQTADAGSQDSEGEQPSRRKELWILRAIDGSFLSYDSQTNRMSCSKVPLFWQSNGRDLTLTCTSDTPLRRLHYRKSWQKQSVNSVRRMREHYLRFDLDERSIRDVLGMAQLIPAFPFRVSPSQSISLRTLSVRLDT